MKITEKYVFFWGSEFSNWYQCSFELWGRKFTSSEQALMYKKAVLFNDYESAEKIIELNDPASQKQTGRKVKNYDDKIWSANRYNIMVEILCQKFEDPILRKKLLSTGNRLMVEASPHDTIWGVGLHENDSSILEDKNWKGMNLLGKALMEVRKAKTEAE